MFTKVSVLTPTRGRIERLRGMLESYDCTAIGAEDSSEMVFRVDEDDVETQRFLDASGHRVVVGPRIRGYESLPVFFNELFPAATGDVLMCGNDDIVFKTVHWAPLLLAEANKYPDGLFNIGVTTLNADHFPYGIVSRRVAERMGFYWDPRIFWGDIFLRDVMLWFGRCVMAPHVRIDHDWAGNRPDQTFNEGNAERFKSRGNEYWDGVHTAAVHEAVEKLRELVQ